MRLIDAERETVMLKKAAVHMLNGFPDSYDTGVSKGLIEAADIINHAPAVDAVPVVRCKDCRHFREAFFGEKYCNRPVMCGFAEIGDLGDDDYCSYGERRADE